jgi:hypothetical protein
MTLGTNTISGLNSSAAQAAQQDAQDGAAQAERIENSTARFQTKMGRLQMMLKINEAFSKMLKALGDGIKGLV